MASKFNDETVGMKGLNQVKDVVLEKENSFNNVKVLNNKSMFKTIVILISFIFIFAGLLSAADKVSTEKKKQLPRFLDLGADKCVACKAMVPVLEKLKKECEGRLKVEFIDVWKDNTAGKKYKINSIPTQIFFSPEGKELWRHVGFISVEDIYKELKSLGYDFSSKK